MSRAWARRGALAGGPTEAQEKRTSDLVPKKSNNVLLLFYLGHAVVGEDRAVGSRAAAVGACAKVPPRRAEPDQGGPPGEPQQLPRQQLRPALRESNGRKTTSLSAQKQAQASTKAITPHVHTNTNPKTFLQPPTRSTNLVQTWMALSLLAVSPGFTLAPAGPAPMSATSFVVASTTIRSSASSRARSPASSCTK